MVRTSMRHTLTTLGIVIAATMMSGCAFGTRHVNLSYAPGLGAMPAGTSSSGRVAVAKFEDARNLRQGTGSLLGKVRNGYGIPTASVLANQDPVLWVNEGVARALTAQGLTVERVNSVQEAGGAPIVSGRVTRASGGMYASMDANISADLAIQYGGREIGALSCNGQASKLAWTVSSDEYRTLFEAAMTDFVNQCGPPLARVLTGPR
jgi:hypothetical protein